MLWLFLGWCASSCVVRGCNGRAQHAPQQWPPSNLLLQPSLSVCAGVVLDSIVTVADAKHVERQLQHAPTPEATPSDLDLNGSATPSTMQHGASHDGAQRSPASGAAVQGSSSAGVNEAQRQIAYADVVLLNKCDLVDTDELARVEAAVRRHNAAAKVRTVPIAAMAVHSSWLGSQVRCERSAVCALVQ